MLQQWKTEFLTELGVSSDPILKSDKFFLIWIRHYIGNNSTDWRIQDFQKGVKPTPGMGVPTYYFPIFFP